jgi:hypothetical protein
MSNALAVGALVATVFGLSQSASQPIAMPLLAVPGDRLPANCRLKPEAPSPSPVPGGSVVTIVTGTSSTLGMPSNPWIGTDRRTLAEIRRRMGDLPMLTDAALTGRDASRYLVSLAEGVEEGYTANYSDADSREIVVHALRLSPTELAVSRRHIENRPANQTTTRIEIGTTVAVVIGNEGQCRQAIESHLRSLAGPTER